MNQRKAWPILSASAIGLLCLASSLVAVSPTYAAGEADFIAAYQQGDLLYRQGDFRGAAKAYERALTLAPLVFGAENENTATVMRTLAETYRELGQYDRAESLFERSLEILQARLGPNSLDVAHNLNLMGILYCQTGQFAKGEPCFQRSLAIRQAQLGENHADVAQTMHNMAMFYHIRGDLNKALPLLQRSLAIRESQLGPDHPRVAETLSSLASLYDSMGRYADAVPLYRRSLRICESKLGPSHPQVARSLDCLAVMHWQLAQYEQAEPLLKRSLAISQSRLGPDHPDVAGALHNLAALYKMMNRYAESEQLFQRSLKLYEAKFGVNHPQVADCLRSLETLYLVMDRYADAETALARSLKIHESHFGPDHRDLASDLIPLASLYSETGQPAKAESLYQRCLRIFESKLGSDHPRMANVRQHLADLHARTERWSEAVAEKEIEQRIERRHVARTLPALSEKEQLAFLHEQHQVGFHAALSLGLLRRADPETVLRSAGWVLNGKAIAQETLAQRQILAAEAASPALRELTGRLLHVRSGLAALTLTPPKSGQEAEHRRQVQTLTAEEDELARQHSEATGRSPLRDPWVEPAAVRKAVPAGSLLIEVVCFQVRNWKAKQAEPGWLSPRYVAWLIPAEGQGEISVVDLGEMQPIDEAIERARGALENAEKAIGEEGEAAAENKAREGLRRLARLVWTPLQPHLGQAHELILSPDFALWLVPWGALPLADGKYAIEKYQIRYVVSGRDLLVQGGRTPKSSAPILFANPDYDLAPAQVDMATRAVFRGAMPGQAIASSRAVGNLSALPQVGRLPGTAKEAAAIRPHVGRYAAAEPVVYISSPWKAFSRHWCGPGYWC